MSVFEIFYDGLPIGHSAFELGDAPMGVAFGRFFPLPAYSRFQATCIAATRNESREQMPLFARQPDGTLLPAQGVSIRDLGQGEIEVEAVGIPYPLYERLFPEHVVAYRNLFSDAG